MMFGRKCGHADHAVNMGRKWKKQVFKVGIDLAKGNWYIDNPQTARTGGINSKCGLALHTVRLRC